MCHTLHQPPRRVRGTAGRPLLQTSRTHDSVQWLARLLPAGSRRAGRLLNTQGRARGQFCACVCARADKKPALLAANPNGLVPVVVDSRDGNAAVVYESLVCCEYIDEAFGAEATLLPGAPAERAKCRLW